MAEGHDRAKLLTSCYLEAQKETDKGTRYTLLGHYPNDLLLPVRPHLPITPSMDS
jgi:hypothetical protein